MQEAQVFLNRVSARLLSTVAKVRPDERKDAGAAFLTLFGFMAGHALLETARDALFLGSLSARRLPWVYLTIALVALLLGQREPPFARRFSTRNELTGWLVFAAAVTAAFWVLIPWSGSWIYYALYTWSGVLATLVVVRFWTLLSGLFTVTQAKRLFALIGVGSVAGAILGSGLARVLAVWLPARHLVLAGALVFLLSSGAPSLLSRGQVVKTHLSGLGRVWDMGTVGRMIWARPYLRKVAVLILAATVTFTMVDFVFKLTVDRYVGSAEMGAFFSSVYLGLNLLSLFFQLFLVSFLFRKVGVNAALAIVPGLILATAAGFALVGGLGMVLLLKGADGGLRHSLYRTGTELLFVPISGELRSRVKGFIDVLGQRGGQALGSIIILMVLSVTGNELTFSVLACGTGALWLFLTLDLKRHYLDLFRETLNQEVVTNHREFPALDMASLETLLATLNASDDRQVVAALELLGAESKLSVVPALLLYHPSPPVVMRALELFASSGRTDFLAMADRLLEPLRRWSEGHQPQGPLSPATGGIGSPEGSFRSGCGGSGHGGSESPGDGESLRRCDQDLCRGGGPGGERRGPLGPWEVHSGPSSPHFRGDSPPAPSRQRPGGPAGGHPGHSCYPKPCLPRAPGLAPGRAVPAGGGPRGVGLLRPRGPVPPGKGPGGSGAPPRSAAPPSPDHWRVRLPAGFQGPAGTPPHRAGRDGPFQDPSGPWGGGGTSSPTFPWTPPSWNGPSTRPCPRDSVSWAGEGTSRPGLDRRWSMDRKPTGCWSFSSGTNRTTPWSDSSAS